MYFAPEISYAIEYNNLTILVITIDMADILCSVYIVVFFTPSYSVDWMLDHCVLPFRFVI